jgi:hypothetical protein
MTHAELEAEVAALKKRVEDLEARYGRHVHEMFGGYDGQQDLTGEPEDKA